MTRLDSNPMVHDRNGPVRTIHSSSICNRTCLPCTGTDRFGRRKILTLLLLFTPLLRLIPMEAVRSGPYPKIPVRAGGLQKNVLCPHVAKYYTIPTRGLFRRTAEIVVPAPLEREHAWWSSSLHRACPQASQRVFRASKPLKG